MLINGLQKLTLLDFPGRAACTVFTGGCNFRCPFCYNTSLVLRTEDQPQILEEDIFAFLEKRHGLLDGVCVTGGEPTLQPGLVDFLLKIKDHGFLVKLDTNGSRPEVLRKAIEAGAVDRVAMDIKSSPERYGAVCGVRNVDMGAIRESVDMLLAGTVDYEFRTTVVRELHSERDIEGAAEFIKGAKEYYLQCFRNEGDILGGSFSAYNRLELEVMLRAARKHVPAAQLRGVDD